MSSVSSSTRQAEDQYESQNDQVSGDVPAGDAGDNEYASRTGQSHIPVQKDEAAVEEGGYEDPSVANSDQQLARDDNDAIDQDNIIDSRTRGAAKKQGAYREPGDEEGLAPPEDGTSSVA